MNSLNAPSCEPGTNHTNWVNAGRKMMAGGSARRRTTIASSPRPHNESQASASWGAHAGSESVGKAIP